MEQSMSDQLRMSYQPSLLNLIDVTSSPASGSGITHSPEPDGPTIDVCGPDRVLASLSPRQAKEMGLLTSGTYGLRGSTLSSSADLASSLVSRYRAKTRCLGSTLFTLTWKVRYTPSQRPIFAVRASGLRISDRDCTSLAKLANWKTPCERDHHPAGKHLNDQQDQIQLAHQVELTNWRSPSASDGEGGVMEIRAETAGKYKLRDEAELANLGAWPSPMAGTPAQNGYNEAGNTDSSRKTVELVSWPTPCQQGGPNGGPNQGTDRLPGAADLAASWATPAVRDSKGANSELHVTETGTGRMHMDQLANQAVHLATWMTTSTEDAKTDGQNIVKEYQSDIDANRSPRTSIQRLRNQVQAQLTDSGEMPSGSIAATGNGGLSGQLNPGHSRWLMSLPPIWDVCGIRAADAIRSARSSKKAKAG